MNVKFISICLCLLIGNTLSCGEDIHWEVFLPIFAKSFKDNGEKAVHLFYPLGNQTITATEERSNFIGLIWQRRVLDPNQPKDDEGMFFPFYFYRKTDDPSSSYEGLFPLGGSVKNHLGYDKISWALWPIYMRLEKGNGARISLPWPFIQWQEGPEVDGFAFWPLFGYFSKQGSYSKSYFLWPFFYEYIDWLDQPTPRRKYGFWPLYTAEESQNYRSRTYLWPFFGCSERMNPQYIEDRIFWPFFVQGRGEKNYVNRWAPFYTYSKHNGFEKNWVLWPASKRTRWEAKESLFERNQLFYFLVFHEIERKKANPSFQAEKLHIWPLCSYWNNGQGRRQLQALSPLEVFFPNNEVVRKLYTPLFAFYRSEINEIECTAKRDILFGLIQHKQSPNSRKLQISFLLDTEETRDGFSLNFFKGLLGFGKQNNRSYIKILGRII